MRSDEEIEEIKSWDQEFGRNVYKGNYQAIYLDEVQRTDGTKASLDYVKLNTKCRYGKYTLKDLDAYREATASEEEYRKDKEFAHATYLTAYHYHEDGQSDRTTVDSSNAKSLVMEAEQRNKPIMIFKATHTPESEASSLEQASAKCFQNMPNNLFLIEGAPIMLSLIHI